ncbi:endonuclease/exonuclease/phosphatase family protein [Kineosporia sp. A_224]|uniref:endonuclease/exonuclease/phosphatase family protein n=1 Tax=Kineosporia sp. A_224 TaxID=1962180 RepID=UPI000B4BF3C8|nr:endonuclease/exonuclease/phosphatase family protein [Kineosporia sp. A_224]
MVTPLLRRRSWLAVLALLVPLVAVAGTASAQEPARVRVLQLNLCGSGYAVCWTGRAAPRAAAVIRASAPDAVTLNETCADDVPALRRALAEAHDRAGSVRTAFAPAADRRTGEPIRCRTGGPYGEAVLVWTPGAGGGAATTGAYRAQDPHQDEQRVWACLPTDRLTVCTTHLTSGSPAGTLAQCTELLRDVLPGVRTGRPGVPVVVAGDLNLVAAPAGPGPAAAPGRDLAACVPAGSGYRHADDGVQHVLTSDLRPGAVRLLDMARTTDHPGLLASFSAG